MSDKELLPPEKKEFPTAIVVWSIIAVSIAILIWKLVLEPFSRWIAVNSFVTAVIFLFIFIFVGICTYHFIIGPAVEKDREMAKLRAELESRGLEEHENRYGIKRWGTKEEVNWWKSEDTEEHELNVLCDGIVTHINEFAPVYSPSGRFSKEAPYKHQLAQWLKNHYPNIVIEEKTDDSIPDIIIKSNNNCKIAIEVKGPTKTQDLETLPEKASKYLKTHHRLIFALFDPEYSQTRYSTISASLLGIYGDKIRFVALTTAKEVTDG